MSKDEIEQRLSKMLEQDDFSGIDIDPPPPEPEGDEEPLTIYMMGEYVGFNVRAALKRRPPLELPNDWYWPREAFMEEVFDEAPFDNIPQDAIFVFGSFGLDWTGPVADETLHELHVGLNFVDWLEKNEFEIYKAVVHCHTD